MSAVLLKQSAMSMPPARILSDLIIVHAKMDLLVKEKSVPVTQF